MLLGMVDELPDIAKRGRGAVGNPTGRFERYVARATGDGWEMPPADDENNDRQLTTHLHLDTSRKVITESFRIQIRNHKKEAAKVIIRENLFRWTQWEITQSSDTYEKIDARTIHFEVTVPPDGEKTVTYTVRYTW